MRLKTVCIGFLLFCCLFFAWDGMCYEITEAELTTLETNLTKLKKINLTSQQKLNEVEKLLEKSEKKSETLERELIVLQANSTQQEILLMNANKSLQEYEQEEKRKARTIKAQRIIIYGLCAGLVYSMLK